MDFTVVPMSDFQLVLGDEFIDRLLPFTFTEDSYKEFTDAGKRHKVPIELVSVRGNVFGAFQVRCGEKTCLSQQKQDGTSSSSTLVHHSDAARSVLVGSCRQNRRAVGQAQVLNRKLDEGVKHFSGGECHGLPKRTQSSKKHKSMTARNSLDQHAQVPDSRTLSKRSVDADEQYPRGL